MTGRNTTYRVIDEPTPGRLVGCVVNPTWPLLSLMLGGAGVGWLWFGLNAWALGSSTRRRELGLLALSFVLVFVCVAALIYAEAIELIPWSAVLYLAIALPVIKLTAGYWVFRLQQQNFALYSYYGGRSRSGVLALLVAAALSHTMFVRFDFFWRLVLR